MLELGLGTGLDRACKLMPSGKIDGHLELRVKLSRNSRHHCLGRVKVNPSLLQGNITGFRKFRDF